MLYRLLARLPLPLLYALSWIAYVVLYHLVRYRRDTVRGNLTDAFPEKSQREIHSLGKAFYRQLTEVAVEIVKARYMSRDDFLQRTHVANPHLLREISNNFQVPVIILTIHQGNWEWMLHGASAALGVPLDPIYKPLHNSSADRFMLEVRSRFGCRPLPLAQSGRDILRHRRKFRLLVMVADQSPTRQERSVWNQFLNRDTAFHLGAETIARLTDYPVVFAQCRRRRRGFYEIEFQSLASPPYNDEEGAITQRYAQMAERAIHAEPQSWLWSNRRWKRNRNSEANEAGSGSA